MISIQSDPRNIETGWEIPSEHYCDQPYVVITPSGDWVCIMTTGYGREGQPGQHIVATISQDQGKTWCDLIDIERSDDTESAYAVPFITPAGRIYAFYNYNGDRFDGGRRNDELGWYVFRFSDDGGRTWSDQRYRIPMRVTQVDRENSFDGAVQLFWGIGKPIVKDDVLYLPFSKMAQYPQDHNEGWIFVSDNILSETNPEHISWALQPEGDAGIKNPSFSSVQEEHNIALLDNGSIICIYRTTMGYAAQSISSDDARSWSEPEIMCEKPGGRGMKTPRACPMIWKISSGRYLFWYHNNSTFSFGAEGNRNPVWLSGGIERNGQIEWSQPEILLYSPEKIIGMSYPDLIQANGCYWTAHTNKTVARINKIDNSLIEGLFHQETAATVPADGLILESDNCLQTIDWPVLPGLLAGGGFTVSLRFCCTDLSARGILLDTRGPTGQGIVISISDQKRLKIELIGQRHWVSWDTDPGQIQEGRLHHVTFIVDGAAKVLSVVVDGTLCDGGTTRPYGWCHIPDELNLVNGSLQAQLGSGFSGTIETVHVFNRYLRTSEAISLHRACK